MGIWTLRKQDWNEKQLPKAHAVALWKLSFSFLSLQGNKPVNIGCFYRHAACPFYNSSHYSNEYLYNFQNNIYGIVLICKQTKKNNFPSVIKLHWAFSKTFLRGTKKTQSLKTIVFSLEYDMGIRNDSGQQYLTFWNASHDWTHRYTIKIRNSWKCEKPLAILLLPSLTTS